MLGEKIGGISGRITAQRGNPSAKYLASPCNTIQQSSRSGAVACPARIIASRRDQCPSAGKIRTRRGTDSNIIVHVPNSRLMSSRVIKEVVGPAVAIEIGGSNQIVRGRNCRPRAAAGVSDSRHVSNHGSMRARIEQQVVGLAIAVEVSNSSQGPARWKSWPSGTANMVCVAHEPDYRSTSTRIKKHEVRITVAVEISSRDQLPTAG